MDYQGLKVTEKIINEGDQTWSTLTPQFQNLIHIVPF